MERDDSNNMKREAWENSGKLQFENYLSAEEKFNLLVPFNGHSLKKKKVLIQ